MTYRIELSYATFSIDVAEGRVLAAPPIGRWMIGKPTQEIRDWVARKGGKIERVAG